MSHTTVGLGVTGYEIVPKYSYDTEDYEVTVGANVELVDIYAYANHVHKNSSTLITVLKEVEGHENIAGAALNSIVTAVKLTTGINKFIVRVESEDATATKDYRIKINRNQRELNLETLIVDGVRAQRYGNEYFAYVDYDTVPTVRAQSDDPTHVKTSIISSAGLQLGTSSTSTDMAYAENGTNDHNSKDNTSILTIRLTDNSDSTHVQDFRLTIIPAGTDDILRIMLGTPEGRFDTSDELGYAMPVTAKWDADYVKADGTKGAYIVNEATVRVITVSVGKLVKIGSFAAQIFDYYDTTGKQFTSKDKVSIPQEINIGVTEYKEVADVENLVYRNYTLIVEAMSNEADLINADFTLPTDADIHRDFTENLPEQLNHTYTVSNADTYITFKHLRMSDNATGKYIQNSMNYSHSGIFEENEEVKFMLKEGINDIKLNVTSEDGTVTKTYTFSITRIANDDYAKLNDIIIQIGDKYYDTVSVPVEDNTSDKFTYHFTIPQEIDESETPIMITAVPFDDGFDYEIVNRVSLNDNQSSNQVSSRQVVYGTKLVEGDRLRVIFNVYNTNKTTSEYAIELFKDSYINLDPEMAYLTNIMRADTGKPLTRVFVNNQYDYNYYDSVDEDTMEVKLSLSKNIGAQNCDVYLLETYIDSNNNKVEKKTLVSNMLEYPMILQKGDNTVVFEVSESNGAGKVQNARYYSVIINRAAGPDTVVLKDTTSTMMELSHNAELSNINSENYALLTAMFDKDVHEYFLAIPYDEDKLSLIVEAADEHSDLRIRKEGGEELYYNLGSTAELNDIPLHYGSNKIVITVTAEDNITKETYIIDAHRATPEHTGDIIHMDYTEGSNVTPLFNAKLTNYYISYDYDVDTVSFTPSLRPEEVEDPTGIHGKSYIYVRNNATNNGSVKIESGQTYTMTNVPYGDTELLFKVVTFNGTEKHYVVTVNRAYNKDRPYIELPIEIYSSSTGAEESRYTLSSDFYHSEHAYYLNVPNDTSEVWVKATVGSEEDTARQHDSVKLNNATLVSGNVTGVKLYEGDNVLVFAVDNTLGTKERYTVVINKGEDKAKAQYDVDMKLDGLKLTESNEELPIIPEFRSDQYSYTVVVDKDTEEINMIPYFDETTNMYVTINNMPITSSGEKLSDAEKAYMGDNHLGITKLKHGANYFDIVLTSEIDFVKSNGDTGVKASQTTVHYVVNVVRPNDTIAELDYLAVDKGSMAPVFDPSIHNYYVTVPFDVDTITVDTEELLTHFVEETKDYVPVVATVSSTSHVVNNHDGTFDVTSPAGQDSTVIFMVYPSKETNYPTSVYSLTINRRTHDTIKSVDLKDLTVTAGGKNVEFTTDFTARDVNYYAYVDSNADEVVINATPEYDGTNVNVHGGNTVAISKPVTTVIVETGNDSKAKQRYSVTIIRKSTTALTDLIVNGDTVDITDGYSSTVVNTDAVNNLPFDLTANDPDAVIRVNGRRVMDGNITELISTDREKYTIRVTADDRNSYVYTLFVNADKQSDHFEPFLKDIIVKDGNGTMGTFDKSVTGNVHKYNVMVDTSDIELFAYPLNDDNAYIEIFDVYGGNDVVRSEYLDNYTVTTQFSDYIKAQLDDTDKGVFKFRVTEYAESGFENVSEYIVNIYKTDVPILTDLRVEPSPDAVMSETFNGTNYGDYHVYIGKSVEEFDVIAESYQNVGIQIGKVLPDGSVDYNDPAVDGAYRKTIDTPLDEDNFTVLVKITYDKILPGGDSEERSAVYTLKVIRAPYDKSNAYLADLAVIEEDEPNNGKYELDKNYNKLIRLYETVIDYTDNSVSLVIKKEYENDTVLAQLGTENQVEMFTDIAQEFILPISFMEDDDATANIDFTVISPEADDVGYYRVVVRRSERAQSKIRLDNLVLDDGDTDLYDYDTSSTVIDPFDSETFKYSAIVQAGQESINILAASREPADTVIITHNGVSTENVDNVPNDYDLSTTSNEDIFFITVYSSLDETEKTTYVLKVIQQNTAFLTNLEVTDDNPDDEYYELDPEFEQNTNSYTVKVPVLAQDMEFDEDYIARAYGLDNRQCRNNYRS